MPTFDRPDGICDFVFQTAQELAHQNVVIILALGENWRGRSGLKKWLSAFQELSHTTMAQTSVKNDGLAVYLGMFHFLPFQRFDGVKKANEKLNLLILNLVISTQFSASEKLLWVFNPSDGQALSSFDLQAWHLHYDAVDWHTSCFPERQKQISMKRKQLVQLADSITVLTQPVLERIKKLTKKKIELVPQGFDVQGLTAKSNAPESLLKLKRSLKKLRKPIIGYFGAVSARLDIALLCDVAKHSPDFHFVFIGPRGPDESATISSKIEHEIDLLLRMPNVSWHPAVQRACLLTMMEDCAALILPYNTSYEFNQCCFPMKAMEYLFAGKPIVATPVPSLRSYQKVIKLADSATAFTRLLDEAVKKPLTPAQKNFGQRIVKAQTWHAKLDCVDAYLNKMLRS